jgi:[glutamine synthetase] adenylyltransferase / [glutamine synthetase]-adenylyl-L-tyrosine phosphorylase
VVLDCEQGQPLADVTVAVTELAEWSLDLACQAAQDDVSERFGRPSTRQGQTAVLWVIGMGKLGARELNVSSDIDLIYVYDQEGETTGLPDGRGKIACSDYFARVIKRMQQLIGETTEHGFVFRVDLALRPNGNSGPSAVCLAALEDYLQVQGREWERFAWMKSRVVAPLGAIDSGSAQQLRSVVLPFVFRRYLDYNVFESLRTLHKQIRDHAAKRSAGHPERANDVKLSRGGIREIEFTVQLLQVVRGGQYPELRTRPTLDALARLTKAQLMGHEKAGQLHEAYVFLRRLEHRIQYLDDQQTHVLPTDDADLAWIAATLGFADVPAFLDQLHLHRERVATEFDSLLGGAAASNNSGCSACNKAATNTPAAVGNSPWDALLARSSPLVQERLRAWLQSPRVTALRDDARQRLQRLLERTVQWLLQGSVQESAVLRLTEWMEALLRRESYLALLIERPAVHERLLRLLGAARWPARYLLKHPGVIDELASGSLLTERFDAASFEAELSSRKNALQRTGEDDEENLLNLLRRAHHAEVFRVLARDVEGVLSVEQVADDLSALADSILRITARWCWQRLKQRHQEAPQMAIIAYGKLGGKELGYGSDLDVVFVYDDEDDRAPEAYGAYVRKLITWLTVKTAEGDLYEIDTALRPNGNSGLLVTRFDAFANYQGQRGSNTAWTWEHQAMTRARFVVGSPALEQRFEAVRQAVIAAPRQADALHQEIAAMRQRVRQAHPVDPDLFDVKHSHGGMVDAEFVVQYLVLLHGAQHPSLAENIGNIALLERAEQLGLLPPGMGEAAGNAYRKLRATQHRCRLNEEPTQVPLSRHAAEQAALQALWGHVLG